VIKQQNSAALLLRLGKNKVSVPIYTDDICICNFRRHPMKKLLSFLLALRVIAALALSLAEGG